MIVDVHSHTWQYPDHFTADFQEQARQARGGAEMDLTVTYDAYRATADNTFYKSKEKLAAYVATRRLQPLSKSEFYESTGEVNWPIGLLHPHDEKGRREVEALFKKRAQDGSLEPAEYVRLNKLLRDWVNHIGSHRDEFSASDTKEAARFLRRLEMNLKNDFQ